MKSRVGNKRKRRIEPEQKCRFTATNTLFISYKDLDIIEKMITPYGKILGRKKTGTKARYQRQLTIAIKRARFLALLPYVGSTLKD